MARARRAERATPRARSRSSLLANAGCAGDQAINNRTAGTIRTRSRKSRLQRSRHGGQVGEVRALRDQGSQAIGVSQAQG